MLLIELLFQTLGKFVENKLWSNIFFNSFFGAPHLAFIIAFIFFNLIDSSLAYIPSISVSGARVRTHDLSVTSLLFFFYGQTFEMKNISRYIENGLRMTCSFFTLKLLSSMGVSWKRMFGNRPEKDKVAKRTRLCKSQSYKTCF